MSRSAAWSASDQAPAPMTHQRVFQLKLRETTRRFGLKPTSCDEDFETSSNLFTAKHVDDINMAGTEDTIDRCVKCVEDAP
eukprot:2437231-Pyramimonas_sp.AAC.2